MPPNDERKMWATAARAAGAGLQIAMAIVVGGLTGAWLDGHINTAPWGLLAGLLVGLVTAVASVARLLHRWQDG